MIAATIASSVVIPIAVVNSRCEHTYDNACDAVCNECGEERTVEKHNWVEADCDTPKTCNTCGATEGEPLGHTPSADDGNCLTAITCKDCVAVTTPAREAHTPSEDDGDCTTWVLCECGWLAKEANEAHVPNEDDGDCTTAVTCAHCDYVVIEAKEHLLEEYVDNGNGTHSLKCKNCDYKDSVEIEHYDYFNGDCECDKCGALHYLPHVDDNDCTCFICYEEIHSFNEECVCEVCQITYHDVDPSTGICLRCDSFEASTSITVEGEKNYYATLLEAFTAAGALNNCTVVLENDVFTDIDNLKNITQGTFTIDLNGKTIDKAPYMGSSYVFVIGASVTIKDSVGGGKITALQLRDGVMNIENGLFGDVFISGGVCTVAEGEFDLFSATTGSSVQIAGGSYKEVQVYKTVGTLDTLLTEGYCFYDTQGNVIDISSIEQVNGWYEIVNVTVNEVQ